MRWARTAAVRESVVMWAMCSGISRPDARQCNLETLPILTTRNVKRPLQGPLFSV